MPIYKQEDIAYVVETDGKILCSKCYDGNADYAKIVTTDEYEQNEELAICDNCQAHI